MNGCRLVSISYTIGSLQDQLHERDLPAVLEVLGLELSHAVLKGKQNYLCPRALDHVEGRDDAEREVLEALRAWAAGHAEGDLDRFDPDDA